MVLRIYSIDFEQSVFPLFSKNSDIIFPCLEHFELQTNNISEIIYILIENFSNITNLRILSIRSKNINSSFSYHKIIISKCLLLKKLHTLIIGSEIDGDSDTLNLDNVEKYYSTYPELKKTNIIFCKL